MGEQVYVCVGPAGLQAGYSPVPEVDVAWWAGQGYPRAWLLTRPVPAWVAAAVARVAAAAAAGWPGLGLRLAMRRAHRALQRLGWGAWACCEPATPAAPPPLSGQAEGLGEAAAGPGWSAGPADPRLLTLLSGRLWLARELERALGGPPPWDALQQWVCWGVLGRRPGVEQDEAGRWHCCRCGSHEHVVLSPCWRCHGHRCPACTACGALGEVRGCDVVYYDRRGEEQLAVLPAGPASEGGQQPATELAGAPSRWQVGDLRLSPAQAAAAEQLLRWAWGRLPGVSTGASLGAAAGAAGGREALVWAVCGAGKTEVSFPLMAAVLEAGGQVLFAIPRRDVVVELEERVRAAFPERSVLCLYGGSPQRFGSEGQIVLATTHQAMRFYRRFDLVVLDEVDAFPYRGSAALRRGVERARRPAGLMVYMTATPDSQLLERVRSGRLTTVTIPARHHGHPLPAPEVVLDRRLAGLRGALRPAPGAAGPAGPGYPPWLAELLAPVLEATLWEAGAALLAFVPAVELVDKLARYLNRLAVGLAHRLGPPAAGGGGVEPAMPGSATAAGDQPFLRASSGRWAAGVHAADPERDVKRRLFQEGRLPILVSTTVLERGITVERVHVAVLLADEERVFGPESLVQMAGRSGRSARWPHGRVWWLAVRETAAMREAARQIETMNREAWERGYLRSAPGCTAIPLAIGADDSRSVAGGGESWYAKP